MFPRPPSKAKPLTRRPPSGVARKPPSGIDLVDLYRKQLERQLEEEGEDEFPARQNPQEWKACWKAGWKSQKPDPPKYDDIIDEDEEEEILKLRLLEIRDHAYNVPDVKEIFRKMCEVFAREIQIPRPDIDAQVFPIDGKRVKSLGDNNTIVAPFMLVNTETVGKLGGKIKIKINPNTFRVETTITFRNITEKIEFETAKFVGYDPTHPMDVRTMVVNAIYCLKTNKYNVYEKRGRSTRTIGYIDSVIDTKQKYLIKMIDLFGVSFLNLEWLKDVDNEEQRPKLVVQRMRIRPKSQKPLQRQNPYLKKYGR